ncbi:hypothetical protein C9926_01110 [Sulfurovum lithotrophicum]|nr:hypothetical protein C9926_01110 [Sulfurovum lithotrophicum]
MKFDIDDLAISIYELDFATSTSETDFAICTAEIFLAMLNVSSSCGILFGMVLLTSTRCVASTMFLLACALAISTSAMALMMICKEASSTFSFSSGVAASTASTAFDISAMAFAFAISTSAVFRAIWATACVSTICVEILFCVLLVSLLEMSTFETILSKASRASFLAHSTLSTAFVR